MKKKLKNLGLKILLNVSTPVKLKMKKGIVLINGIKVEVNIPDSLGALQKPPYVDLMTSKNG